MNWKDLLIIGIILVSAWVISTIIRVILNFYIRRNSVLLKVDPTNFSFIKNSVSFVIYSIAFFFIISRIPSFKELTDKLIVGAGILTAIIAFASQKVFANIFSGIFILFSKPYRVTDTIEFGTGIKGVVEEITLRHTIIRDYENRRIIVPNSVINEETILNSNITDERIRKFINIGISYDSDFDKASKIMKEEVQNHKHFLDVRTEEDIANSVPPVIVRMIEYADSAIMMRAYAWSENNDKAFELKCDVLESIKKRFDKEGIEIPFPHRTIVYKNPPN
ncbi:MAG: mechanosensitive ion channel family protein [Bacteroidales bacterium]|nr:mechanosensitive ion channel family protein [Bacteroidales bacterium]